MIKKVTDTESLKLRLKEKGIPFEVLEDFKGSQTKILFNKLTCEHKPFKATPNNILKGTYNCPICGQENRTKTKRQQSPINEQTVINELKEKYPDGRYTLKDGEKYINNKTNMQVLCHKCNNYFGISLVNIRQGRGCPHCRKVFQGKKYSKNSLLIEQYLNNKGIPFKTEYIIPECKNVKPMPFDFYIIDRNLLIEYDGEQHFKPFNAKLQSAIDSFKQTQERDKLKTEFCKSNNIPLARINYKDNVIEKLEKILFNDYPLTGGENPQ